MFNLNPPDKSVATIIYWKDGTSTIRIDNWIKTLKEKGHVEHAITNEYEEKYGAPVWYIP